MGVVKGTLDLVGSSATPISPMTEPKRLSQSLQPSTHPSDKTLLSLVAALSAIGAVSAISCAAFFSQEVVAEQGKTSSRARVEESAQQSYRLDKQKITRSITVLKLGISSRRTRHNTSNQLKVQPKASDRPHSHHSLQSYVDAASFVVTTLSPQYKQPQTTAPAPPSSSKQQGIFSRP